MDALLLRIIDDIVNKNNYFILRYVLTGHFDVYTRVADVGMIRMRGNAKIKRSLLQVMFFKQKPSIAWAFRNVFLSIPDGELTDSS